MAGSTVLEFIPIAGCVRAAIFAHGVNFNCTLINTLAFRASVLPTASEIRDVTDTLAHWVDTKYLGQVTPFVHFDRIEVWSGAEQFGPKEVRSINANGNAVTVLAEAKTDFAAAPLASIHTTSRGRFATGRFYAFTPVPEVVLPNSYAPDHLTGVAEVLENLRQAAAQAGVLWVVASTSRQQLYNVTGVTMSQRRTEQERRRPDFGR